MVNQPTQREIAHRNVSAALTAYVNKQDPEIREILVAYYSNCMKLLKDDVIDSEKKTDTIEP